MSCSQVAPEFSRDKFRLKCNSPVTFWVWRYTCFPQDRSFAIYRVLFASLFILLLILDFLWIVGFAGAGEDNRISASLDATEFALISLCLAYVLLACGANQWHQIRWETNAGVTVGERSSTVGLFVPNSLYTIRSTCSTPWDTFTQQDAIPYKCAWFFYTFSINAVYVTMILFWVSVGPSAPLEQQLKHVIPGCLIFIDLWLTGIPLSLCHVIYVILVYYTYLAIVALALFLSYTFGVADKNSRDPGSPTAWIGGYPLLINGYSDFTNLHRILGTIFGSMGLSIVVHCLLLSVVITRDFFASLFHRSTELWIDDGGLGFPGDSHSTDPLFTAPHSSAYAVGSAVPSTRDEKPTLYAKSSTS